MATISQMFIYPVKSCRGIAVTASRLFDEGLEHDRRWMVVSADGQFLTQRQAPAMARIAVELTEASRPGELAGARQTDTLVGADRHVPSDAVPDLMLRLADAEGQIGPQSPALRISPADDSGPHPAKVWSFDTTATDCGPAAAEFLGKFLGQAVRLVRFDDRQARPCNPKWTAGHSARTRFADGFPVLVLGEASVADLASRMGLASLAMERFRPNIVLSGLPAYEEDFIKALEWPENGANALSLQLTKPCPRCPIPGLNHLTGQPGPGDPTALLATFRYHPAVGGAVLGMNALPLGERGAGLHPGGAWLTTGQCLSPVYDF